MTVTSEVRLRQMQTLIVRKGESILNNYEITP